MSQTALCTRPFRPDVWENENAPAGAVNTPRGLTHSSDLTREGLLVDATRNLTDVERAMHLVLATGANDHQVFALVINGEPIAKSRVRVNGQRHYATGRTTDAELDIARAIQAGTTPPPRFPGNVAVAAVFYRSNRHRVDVDNLLKTALDGITKSGLIWADDDQVTALLGVIEYDQHRPRIVIAVAHHESTMLRGDERNTHTCETCGQLYRPHSPRQKSRYCSRACRPRRVQVCSDCNGPTSAPHVQRCQACHAKAGYPTIAVPVSGDEAVETGTAPPQQQEQGVLL